MQLKPKTFYYKRKQKNRRKLQYKYLHQNLYFGNFGLVLLSALHLTANQIFRFKLYLKRAYRKVDRTRRYAWFNAFPHLPLTRKPKGVRMGKGKGKLDGWTTSIAPGVLLIEFQNLRKGRAAYFTKQMGHKLGINICFFQKFNFKYINFPLKTNGKRLFTNFW